MLLEMCESLPVWGEWIEINTSRPTAIPMEGLSPCGESGLKSAGIARGL